MKHILFDGLTRDGDRDVKMSEVRSLTLNHMYRLI